jgi:hypothetical protein
MESQRVSKPRPQTSAHGQWRTVALPVEHGGWGFLLEPVLLGLLVAPSGAAAALSLAVIAAFLLRQPAKIILVDWRRGRTFARTQLAWRFAILYAGIALLGVATTVSLAGIDWLLPPLLALPFGLIFLYYDLTQPGRTWQAEIAAPVALASATASMAIVDGWMLGPSLALWIALTARAVPSILYVRARLRLDRGKDPDQILPILSHLIALFAVATLIQIELLPWLSLIPFVILLARAIHGLSTRRWRVSVKVIGFVELGLGIATVLLIALGYWI